MSYNKGTLVRLSKTNIYVARDYKGLTIIILDKKEKKSSNPALFSPMSGFDCFVIEKSEKLWFFNYQLDDAEVLCL
jgi:hypothetical protein